MRPHPSWSSIRSVAIVFAVLGSVGAILLVTAPTTSATTYVRGIISVPTTWGGGTDIAPNIISNTILQAGVGFAFVRSSSFVSSNTILRATNVGVYANASNVQITNNAINATGIGIQVEQPGTPTISRNTITNVSSGFAMGILLTAGATASIDGNMIQGVRGFSGAPGGVPGAPGRDGSIGAGIYVVAAPSASITANTIDSVTGGRGGDG